MRVNKSLLNKLM